VGRAFLNVAIGVVSPSAAWVLPREYVDQLRRAFPQHTFLEAWDRDALRRVLLESDAAFAAFVDKDLVASLTRLRWVQAPAAGIGHILSAELAASPIVLTSARGIRARAIAEHVLGMALALARQLPLVLRRQTEHVWALDEIEAGGAIRTLHGKRLGIVGLGSIGTEVARVASAFGMRVTATRKRVDAPVPKNVEVLPPDRLHELLAKSDVIVLSAALTPETRLLLGREALSHVKRGSLLINIGRGRLVDDEAVVEALRDGRLGGAALDVFTREPLDPASPYWDLPNVIVTPHMSGAMEDYWTPLVALFSENLRRFDAGEPLLNVVDKTAGY
jgi:phosphoglycerate dehydrogenase-like enzyme